MAQLSFDELEIWRPIPNWEGAYEASSLGQVRSLPNGRHRGVVLRPSCSGTAGYPHVELWDNGRHESRTVHSLVADAFYGLRQEDQEVRHLDGDRRNPRMLNLVYGTSSENRYDMTRHGRNYNANKTHCDHGHEFTPENTFQQGKDGEHRGCRECRRRIGREWARRKRAELRGMAA